MEIQNLTLQGFWTITLRGPDGQLKYEDSGHNVVTTVGKEYLARYLYSAATSGANTLKYVAIGTGATTETAADTSLGTEVARVSGTPSYTSGAIFNIVATFPAGTGTGAITEFGLYSSSTGGTLFSRTTRSVINKAAGDDLTTTVQVTFS